MLFRKKTNSQSDSSNTMSTAADCEVQTSSGAVAGSRSSCSSSSTKSLTAAGGGAAAPPAGSGDAPGVEVQARHMFDVTFKYTWKVEEYLKRIEGRDNIDSPEFEINVNGLKTKWTMALRFWMDEEGHKMTNPVVVCLNLVSAVPSGVIEIEAQEEIEVLEVRHNFGVWNNIVKQFEVCPLGVQKVSMQTTPTEPQTLQSVAARDVLILDRHLIDGKDIEIYCKIQLQVRAKVEKNTLALDLWNNLVSQENTDVILKSSDGDAFPAHKLILTARSSVLGQMLADSERACQLVEVDCATPVLTALIQYLYTDRVDPLDQAQLLIKCADQFQLPGLRNICERELIDSITPLNVAALLLVADNFNCELLKKACLGYVEDNPNTIVKTVAWKVMEKVNPELFDEVCQK